MSKYYIVHFHADGGQCCSPGHRTFTDKKKAEAFADRMRNEKDHGCGPSSVRIEISDEDKGNYGVIYPGIAASFRDRWS